MASRLELRGLATEWAEEEAEEAEEAL